MWHTIAMGFMLFGLFATIEWHYEEDEPDLYSLHSWLGVRAFVCLCLCLAFSLL